MEPIMEEKNETMKFSEPYGHGPNAPEASSGVPQPSADFRTVLNGAVAFGKIPHAAERRENHTLTVRESARIFETAGVARTERSIINWCQPNRQGMARLDSYFDPNERKYYITPQSVETVIQEELQRAKKFTAAPTAEPFGSPEKPVKHSQDNSEAATADKKKFQELEREILDLKIANRGKDYLIDQLRSERTGFFEQLLSANRKVVELETTVIQLESAKAIGNQLSQSA
jgi:hypothetical protein